MKTTNIKVKVFKDTKIVIYSDTLFRDANEVATFLISKGIDPEECDYEVFLDSIKTPPTAKEFSEEKSLMLFKSVTAYYDSGIIKVVASVTSSGEYKYKLTETRYLW